ncbi:hypothetical protein AY599_18480 [Leptolyngbya valderiana BDU 20041]|nr:hypothetical protein AY599_18480 [Leptolyngbya valderiana BDU 20041]
MHRPGSNPMDMLPSDFVCDFTGRQWDGSFPMVEGHQGSLICGDALRIAYTEVVLLGNDSKPPGATCTMCLEERDDPGWQSPVAVRDGEGSAIICRRCIRQSSTRLAKDPDWGWNKPTLDVPEGH